MTGIQLATAHPTAEKLLSADFDRDGNLDVVWTSAGLIVAYGDGTGQFGNPVVIAPPTGASFVNIALGDLDGDGYPDVVTYTGTAAVAADVYLSTGASRTFTRVAGSPIGALAGIAARGFVVADFDQDGAQDVVLSEGFHLTNQPSNVQHSYYLRGNGDGSFQPAVEIASGIQSGFVDFAAADVNHDDKLDLVGIAQYSAVHVQLGNGNGTFQAPVFYNAGIAGALGQVALADFDWDGHLDIALTMDALGNVGLGLVVMRGLGDGSFTDAQKLATGSSERQDVALLVADLNTDGRSDLIVGGSSFYAQDFTVLLNNSAALGACTFSDSFTYAASDGELDSPPVTVRITIEPVNHPPVIISAPLFSASAGLLYGYDVNAIDQDAGDRLAYALATAPSGMTIAPDSGLIQWLPAANQTGQHAVKVRVYDSSGVFAEQNFTVTVVRRVTVPEVVGQTRTAAEAAIVAATLVVGTVTLASSTTVPAGEVIAQSPLAGASVLEGSAVNLVVSSGPPGPEEALTIIEVTPALDAVVVGAAAAFTAIATLENGTQTDVTATVAWSSSAPATASIAASGVASGLAPGSTTITATLDGISDTAQLSVVAAAPGDTTPPVAAIETPAANSEINAPASIVGTATDASFVKYELDVAPAGEATFTPLATGLSPVASGVLGELDPTLLVNGPYTVRLRVFDAGGNVAEATRTYVVARERKVGLFSLTFQDLNVALSGLPITISRTYDSRDKGQGEFGIGWRFGLQTLRIRTNRVLGTGWTTQTAGISVQLVALDQHYVAITLPDGKVETFDLQLNPTANIGSLDFTNVVGFAPRPGTLGTLEGLDNGGLLIVPGGAEVELLDDTTFQTYDPQRFRYTDRVGNRFVVDRAAGVQSIEDRNGNSLTIAAGGITHSSGRSVGIVRDAQGRITAINDPSGKVQTYAYDARGDLRSHTDPDGRVTQFEYDLRHGLLEVVTPDGTSGVRNEYDEDGRLVATIDGAGHRVEYQRTPGVLQEIVRDRLGNQTVLEYDAVGNVTAATDQLGARTEYAFDARGNQISETDPEGRTAVNTYNAANQILTASDFDGNTSTYVYGAGGRLASTTDAAGNVTTYTYDASGRVGTITAPDGGVTTNTYDAAGNLASVVDALGRTTTITFDAFGSQTSQTDPLGEVTTFTSDTLGRRTSDSRQRTLPSGSQQTQVRTSQYDGFGHIVRSIDALGAPTDTAYDGSGRIASIVAPDGRLTTFSYDDAANLIGASYPDGSSESWTYDAERRGTSSTDRDGRTTSYAYDATGRLILTTYP